MLQRGYLLNDKWRWWRGLYVKFFRWSALMTYCCRSSFVSPLFMSLLFSCLVALLSQSLSRFFLFFPIRLSSPLSTLSSSLMTWTAWNRDETNSKTRILKMDMIRGFCSVSSNLLLDFSTKVRRWYQSPVGVFLCMLTCQLTRSSVRSNGI